jgi:hypothetical protein
VPLTVIALGARPTIDSLTVDVDGGRAIVRGKHLKGAVLR